MQNQVFNTGEPVVVMDGPYKFTRGTFMALKEDPKWADIQEDNALIRAHFVEWLDHDPPSSVLKRPFLVR